MANFTKAIFCKITKIRFFVKLIIAVFSQFHLNDRRIILNSAFFWPYMPPYTSLEPDLVVTRNICLFWLLQRCNFKCCFCCFCCFSGYHDVVFQKVHEKQKLFHTFSVFIRRLEKNLCDFEFPIFFIKKATFLPLKSIEKEVPFSETDSSWFSGWDAQKSS